MNILKNFGRVNGLTISAKPSSDGKTRAKITTVEINTKKYRAHLTKIVKKEEMIFMG